MEVSHPLWSSGRARAWCHGRHLSRSRAGLRRRRRRWQKDLIDDVDGADTGDDVWCDDWRARRLEACGLHEDGAVGTGDEELAAEEGRELHRAAVGVECTDDGIGSEAADHDVVQQHLQDGRSGGGGSTE